jgi:hypothetical protein
MGADRQDGTDLVVNSAEKEGRQINARGREQGEAGDPPFPRVEHPQHQRDHQPGRVDGGSVEDASEWKGKEGLDRNAATDATANRGRIPTMFRV